MISRAVDFITSRKIFYEYLGEKLPELVIGELSTDDATNDIMKRSRGLHNPAWVKTELNKIIIPLQNAQLGNKRGNMSEEIKDLFVSYDSKRGNGNRIFCNINKVNFNKIRELENIIEEEIKSSRVVILNWQRME